MLLAALLCGFPAYAETMTGRVIGVTDGDTLTLLTQNRRVKVRLASIDAPEMRQSWGKKSRRALSGLCRGKRAVVLIWGYDRYRRAIGDVSCNGVPASARQVEAGMAWVYPKYNRNAELLALEEQARRARRGLWSSRKPIPPWKFRNR
jgi:endonuclease YncB( thermonuclease family)